MSSTTPTARLELSRLQAIRAFRRGPLELLERAARLGDVVTLRTGRLSAWLFNHPDRVWDLLATRSRDVKKGPTMEAAAKMLGRGLLTSEGEHHHRQRRLIQPLFHHDRLGDYERVMRDLTDRRVSSWSDGDVLDVRREMGELALSIVGRSLFGTDVEPERAREIAAALTEALSQFGRVFSPFLRLTEHLPIPSTRRFRRARATFDRVVRDMIAERRRAGLSSDDLLTYLLRAQEDGRGMTDREVRDEVLTLFLAGHETTAVALTWTFWLLAGEPAVARILDGASGDERATVIDRILAESLRLRPPAWAIGRRTLLDLDVTEGDRLPAGSVVIVSPWLLHHDERWWPDPNRFDLGRWDPAAVAARPRHAYLPFGGGPRTCIGEGFARREAAIVLDRVTRRWRLVAEPGQDVRPEPAVTLRPAGPVLMRVRSRGAG
ncbi:MAG TPA: cytochrome P450 [Actinomycetota bacterium]|nr:cytochrome P450 [Actinomycetota bacterium]